MRYLSGVFRPERGRFLGIVVVVGSLLLPVLCQATEVTMIMRQSPAEGGILHPDPGLHYYGVNAQVFLAAIPNPGYEFICWLGDVSDPAANRTVVYLDQPKIIIAMFERTEYNTLFIGEGAAACSGGAYFTRGGSIHAADFGAPGPSGLQTAAPSGARPRRIRYETSEPSEPPGPVEPPIPEPATAVLLLAGGWFALTRHGINRYARPARNRSDKTAR